MSDPNSTAIDEGPDAVRSHFDRIGIASLNGFTFQGSAPLVPPPMLVKDLLPFEGIAFIGGQSGAGKTFVALSLAHALATGTQFFGRDVREKVGVIIIAAEGRAMIAARIEAVRQHRTPNIEKLPIAWCSELPSLKQPPELRKFASQLANVGRHFKMEFDVRLGAVIIDTVASSFDLDDEDDNSEASRTVRKLRDIARLTGALMVPVHHYGKNATTGLRGGSGWRAGADAILSVLADRDEITGDVSNRKMALAKARDGLEGPIAPFRLHWLQLAVDEDGAPFGTCVAEPILGAAAQIAMRAAAASKDSRAVKCFRDSFTEALDVSGRDMSVMSDGPQVRAVSVQDVRTQFNRRYATGEGEAEQRSDAARKAFKRTLEKLAGQYATAVVADVEMIWAIK